MSVKEDKELILSGPSQEVPDVCVGKYFVDTMSQFGDNTVIYDAKTGETLTANQLIEKSHNIAVALLKRGITKSDVVLYFSENLIEYAITQFTVFMLGITFTIANKANGVYELSNQIKNTAATIIFTSLKNSVITDKVLEDNDLSKQSKLVVTFDGKHSKHLWFRELLCEGFGKRLDSVPHFPVDLINDICVIGCTSGTTGLPKGTVWSNKAFMNWLVDYKATEDKNNADIFGCSYPFTHVMGTMLFPKYLLMGNAVVIIDMNRNEDLFEAIDKYKITRIGVSLSFGFQLLDDSITNRYDLSSLKHALSGGTPFPSHLVQPIIDKLKLQSFVHVYGMTEFAPITMDSENDGHKYIPGSNGYVAPNVQLKIRDLESNRSLGPNKSGEICVRSAVEFKFFSGYLNNPKATNAAMDENGWFYTGDVGHYDESGRIYITDRIKELIKYATQSIFPAEIEDCLLRHEAIEDAAVVGVPHPIDYQRPRAYVSVKRDRKLTEQEVLKYVSEKMGYRNYLHGGVVFVDKVVRNGIWKIDRKYYRHLVSTAASN